eukprot:10798646-Alexandrium_andersonii.AAC.1
MCIRDRWSTASTAAARSGSRPCTSRTASRPRPAPPAAAPRGRPRGSCAGGPSWPWAASAGRPWTAG